MSAHIQTFKMVLVLRQALAAQLGLLQPQPPEGTLSAIIELHSLAYMY